jgi:serine phosphatase RsbU (regulator of sigma subunit)
MFDEIGKIKEGIINITQGTTIVCYTDGLVELENDKGEDFGIDSLKEIIKNNPDIDMKSLNNLIMKTCTDYKQSKPYIDDIALFSLRIH